MEGEEKKSSLHEKHTDLKQRMRDLNQGFERLRKITHEGFDSDNGTFLLLLYNSLYNQPLSLFPFNEPTLAYMSFYNFGIYVFLFSFCDPVEFKEPRVIELWEMARRSNLTEDELDSLKVTCFSGHLHLHPIRFISVSILLGRSLEKIFYAFKQYELLVYTFFVKKNKIKKL